MPTLWSSSESPISVRTVWVDGIRHAILSKEDPLFRPKTSCQRPRSSTVIKDKNHPLKYAPYKSSGSQSECNFDTCFVNKNFSTDKNNSVDKSQLVKNRNVYRHQSAPTFQKTNKNTDYNFIRNNCIKGESFEKEFNEDENSLEDNCEESGKSSDLEKISYMESSKLKSLSDRVLHWLDISGASSDFDCETDELKINNLKNDENKTVGIVSRRKHPIVKHEELPMKVIVPIQYLIMQETTDILRTVESQLCETKNVNVENLHEKKKENDVTVTIEEIPSNNEDDSKNKNSFLDSKSGGSQSFWTPFKKPQLHIFMPSLKSTEIQRVSSQDSLVVEVIDSCDESS